MTGDTQTQFPAEIELALAHTPAAIRPAFECAMALDQRLGRIVSATTEPMLGQMRLAWWRDMLVKPADERPNGDAVLDAIGRHWEGREDALIRMVDGWEVLVAAEAISADDLKKHADGRAQPFVTMFGEGDAMISERVRGAAKAYLLAELATGLSQEGEREVAISCGIGVAAKRGNRLPRSAKGLAILEALGLRALERGGRPLMEGRTAALVATRAAIIGR